MASLRSINQDDLRNHNLSVVLDSLLRATEPMSRADLAKKTGLTKAAMSVLVSLMLDNEILVEGAPSGQSLYGRPSIPLEIKGGRLCGMGLQANTDGYGVVVLDLDGSVVGEQWVDADMANADERAIFAVSTNWLCSRKKRLPRKVMCLPVPVWHCRVSSPMICDCLARAISVGNVWISSSSMWSSDLILLPATRPMPPRWHRFPAMPRSVRILGGSSPTDSFLYMSTDVGIGGAVIREGRVVSGDHGFGGELGHVSVDMRGPVCRCGRRGCLEVYAGRRSMVSAAGIASSDAAATAAPSTN